MTRIGAERSSAQNPFIRYAVDLGWKYLSADEALTARKQNIQSPVLDTVLLTQLQRLNPDKIGPGQAEDILKRLVRVRPDIEGNLNAWEYLKGLKNIYVQDEKRERLFNMIDFTNIEANSFHVTDEFTFSNGIPPDIRADIVFFINGVPVLIVETKRASLVEGIEDALDDICYYHRKAPEFLALNQLHALTHVLEFYYGATWNKSIKYLFNWRDDSVLEGDFETLCKTFIAPRRMLRVLSNYILFTRKDEVLSKVVLRPHQMRAVDRVLHRIRDREKMRGLIWHTQGSGKTYTMITVAQRLLEDPFFQNPTVLMLVDRNELETQLFNNLKSLGMGRIKVATSKRRLRELLKTDYRGLIVSMIHKFDKMPANINTKEDFYVLVDEAHRTTGADLGNYMMGALPNATYIGFTGTPIDRTQYGRGTFKTFGKDDEKGYLDKYSIRESIEDGTTVPLNYALAPNELRVDRDTLDKEFLNLPEVQGSSDIEELNKVLDRAVRLKNMLKNRDRVKKVAKYVAEDFLTKVEPSGYKAFLVGVDREACCLYKEALDEILPEDYSRVVISKGGKKDPDLLRKYHLSEDQEKDVRRNFIKPEKTPKIIIVTEKLLTGFDAPILFCMYLDKPMRDHVLLQAIARVNRPYEDGEGRRKSKGFVLDFVGIFEKLEKALAFDSKDVSGVIEGIEILEEHFKKLILKGKEEYLPIIHGTVGDKQVEALINHFRDKKRRLEFYAYYQELQDTYEILSPDPFMRPYLEDYATLTDMFFTVKAKYDRGKPIDREFLRKTARLVQEHSKSGKIEHPDKIHVLDSDSLASLAGESRPEVVKVFNLLKAIQTLVDKEALLNPYLISIGERAEAIAKAFEERQIETRKALEELEKLIAELKEAEKLKDKTKLSPDALAVYLYLKREGVKDPMQVAERAGSAFEKCKFWKVSERQGRSVLRSLYKALLDSGIDPDTINQVADHLLKILRRGA